MHSLIFRSLLFAGRLRGELKTPNTIHLSSGLEIRCGYQRTPLKLPVNLCTANQYYENVLIFIDGRVWLVKLTDNQRRWHGTVGSLSFVEKYQRICLIFNTSLVLVSVVSMQRGCCRQRLI